MLNLYMRKNKLINIFLLSKYSELINTYNDGQHIKYYKY